mmetsp:Transcript_6610/g.18420  ORF Transcript_6610/g.18420 Transcript_6610/m.18420 type:complete len:210 (+) Transcript_6610:168-797(+)
MAFGEAGLHFDDADVHLRQRAGQPCGLVLLHHVISEDSKGPGTLRLVRSLGSLPPAKACTWALQGGPRIPVQTAHVEGVNFPNREVLAVVGARHAWVANRRDRAGCPTGHPGLVEVRTVDIVVIKLDRLHLALARGGGLAAAVLAIHGVAALLHVALQRVEGTRSLVCDVCNDNGGDVVHGVEQVPIQEIEVEHHVDLAHAAGLCDLDA